MIHLRIITIKLKLIFMMYRFGAFNLYQTVKEIVLLINIWLMEDYRLMLQIIQTFWNFSSIRANLSQLSKKMFKKIKINSFIVFSMKILTQKRNNNKLKCKIRIQNRLKKFNRLIKLLNKQRLLKKKKFFSLSLKSHILKLIFKMQDYILIIYLA